MVYCYAIFGFTKLFDLTLYNDRSTQVKAGSQREQLPNSVPKENSQANISGGLSLEKRVCRQHERPLPA